MATTPKSPAEKGTAGAKAAAAVSELDDAPKLGKFRDVVLTLPPRLPATFAMDLAQLQATEDMGLLYSMIVDLTGPEAWVKMRASLAASGDALDDWGGAVQEIMKAVSAPYEVDEGK